VRPESVGRRCQPQNRRSRTDPFPPKIVALRDDPEISDMIAQRRFLDLLQDQRIIDAANDPALASQIKKFDLQGALDYAVQQK
jgi:hypothetical protein